MKALLMAGGTGGHVFPALAVAQRLQAAGWQVHWLGSQGGMEIELVQKNGIAVSALPVSGLRGAGVRRLLVAPLRLLRALGGALAVLRRERPDVVLGFGGFASGPGGVAARLSRVPLVVHEQNAIPGLTNRLLARIATRVLVAFPAAQRVLAGAELVGNPVRDAIRAIEAPAERLVGRAGALRILVLGGSLGARALNENVPAALALVARDTGVDVRHQTGRSDHAQVEAAYRQQELAANVVPFIEDMAEAWAWADLAICRAGALTVSELAAAGVPAILVPYPHAVDDHQTHNAALLVDAGAARLLPQQQLTPASLAAAIGALGDRAALRAMAGSARQVAPGDAAGRIQSICEEVARAG